VVGKYNEILWESLQSSSIVTRAEKLTHQLTSQLLQVQQVEYKQIDKAATEYKCRGQLPEDPCQHGTLVPTSLQSNSLYVVLEGIMELAQWVHNWKFSTTTMGKKGGVLNHPANFLLDPQFIQENI